MALDQSALSELLDALRAGGDLDIVREALALVLQSLIEAEAAQVIGAGRYERSAARTTHRNGARTRLLSTRPAMSSCASPNCGRARSSRCCWSHAAGSTGRCWRW
jgi:putative transposase